MDKQPLWVPDWVWGEYLEFINHCGHVSADWVFELDRGDERPAECVARTIVYEKECASLWKAMEKRDSAHCKAWDSEQRSTPEHFFSEERKRTWGLFMQVLSSTAGRSRHLFEGSDVRLNRGQRIASLALRLRRELAQTQKSGCHLPDEIELHVFSEARELAKKLAVQAAEFRQSAGKASSSKSLSDEDHLLRGAMAAFCYGRSDTEPLAFPILQGLEAGGIAWSKSKPIIHRPRDGNADRLLFVRDMTTYFRHWYGTPLRKETATLTQKFFDCEIDGAAVAKLAP